MTTDIDQFKMFIDPSRVIKVGDKSFVTLTKPELAVIISYTTGTTVRNPQASSTRSNKSNLSKRKVKYGALVRKGYGIPSVAAMMYEGASAPYLIDNGIGRLFSYLEDYPCDTITCEYTEIFSPGEGYQVWAARNNQVDIKTAGLTKAAIACEDPEAMRLKAIVEAHGFRLVGSSNSTGDMHMNTIKEVVKSAASAHFWDAIGKGEKALGHHRTGAQTAILRFVEYVLANHPSKMGVAIRTARECDLSHLRTDGAGQAQAYADLLELFIKNKGN